MNGHRHTAPGPRAANIGARCLLAASLAALVAGCNATARDTTSSVPLDYRDRHPIALKEGKQSLALFVGPGRGGLSPTQSAEVLAQSIRPIVVEQQAFAIRDRAMANTVAALLEAGGPDAKALLWAHNGHVKRSVNFDFAEGAF